MSRNPWIRVGITVFVALVVLRVVAVTLRWWSSRSDGDVFVQQIVSAGQANDAEARRMWAAGEDELRSMAEDPRFAAYLRQHGSAEALAKDGLGRLSGQDLLAVWRLRAAWAERNPAFCAGTWTGGDEKPLLRTVLSQATDVELHEWFRLTRAATEAALDGAPRHVSTAAEAEAIAEQGWEALAALMTESEIELVRRVSEGGASVSPEDACAAAKAFLARVPALEEDLRTRFLAVQLAADELPDAPVVEGDDKPLVAYRRSATSRVVLPTESTLPPAPPRKQLELVRYPAPLGDNVAYVTPVQAGERRSAIVWIHGGFDWGIHEGAWAPAPRRNDQSARAFRKAGIVTMFPALRGSSGNPGQNECMFGEVDDVIAAAKWLVTRDDVDPDRIYLGGHSTGGTLALLVAESTDLFRAVLAFGPVADVRSYSTCFGDDPPEFEWRARAPWLYASSITSPTWIVEGAEGGNIESIAYLMLHVGSAPVRAVVVPDRDHFSVLAPATEVIARAILTDTGSTADMDLTADAIVARK